MAAETSLSLSLVLAFLARVCIRLRPSAPLVLPFSSLVSRCRRILQNGYTALMNASWKGHLDLVTLLLARGASVQITDSEGSIPLEWAQHGNHPVVVAALRSSGEGLG